MTGPRAFAGAQAKLLAVEGKTTTEAARLLGIGYATLRQWALREGVRFTPGKRGPKNPKSAVDAAEARRMYGGGMTLEQIGQTFGVTRERVRQILKKSGVCRSDGGQSVRRADRASGRAAAIDRRYIEKYGVTFAETKCLRACGAVSGFLMQRKNARNRAIAWNLTLAQWWRIWEQSGKFAQRGRGRGKYVMARFKDAGAYEIGNVWVCLFERNCADAKAHAKLPDQSGTGNVHYLYPGSAKPWVVKHGRALIGYFAEESEARAAKAAHVASLTA